MATATTLPVERFDSAGKDSLKQKTLRRSVSISGTGLFTGENATLEILPAKANFGIVFQRMDLNGPPTFRADLEHVVNTPRCTILGDSSCTVHTVEHLLAALSALGVHNALLKLSGPEVPILDGSSHPFVESILDAGLIEQEDDVKILFLKNPVSWSKGDVHLVALPSDEFRISYTLHFPDSKILGSQYYSTRVEPEHFINEIAPSRTFCLYEEIAPFIENGLIKGGGLNNAVIIKNDVVINPDGIRFENEMVRHKILDLIGDLSLIPTSFRAHILAVRSGHASNIAFAKQLFQHLMRE